MCHVYKIKNKLTNKVYIGISKICYKQRWKKHCYNYKYNNKYKNIILYSSMRKHGPENFEIDLLCRASSWERAKILERYYIRFYRSFIGYAKSQGYNMTQGGDGTAGYKFTEYQLKKRSEKKLTNEHKRKIKENNARYWLGKNHSEETKEKIRQKRKNQVINDETRKKHSMRWVGKKNPKAKAVLIGDMKFDTVKAAAEYVGIHPENMRKRILSPNFEDHKWYNIKEEA